MSHCNYPIKCTLTVGDGAHTFIHELTNLAETHSDFFSNVFLDHPPAHGVENGTLSYLRLVNSTTDIEKYSIGIAIEQIGPTSLEARLETAHDNSLNPLADGILPLIDLYTKSFPNRQRPCQNYHWPSGD